MAQVVKFVKWTDTAKPVIDAHADLCRTISTRVSAELPSDYDRFDEAKASYIEQYAARLVGKAETFQAVVEVALKEMRSIRIQ
jgi:hypothetical protein